MIANISDDRRCLVACAKEVVESGGCICNNRATPISLIKIKAKPFKNSKQRKLFCIRWRNAMRKQALEGYKIIDSHE
jgi:hypothetical protein